GALSGLRRPLPLDQPVDRVGDARRDDAMKRTTRPPRLAKAKPDAGARGKFYLTYPKKLVKQPLIYQMSRKFELVFNVRSASVSEEIGIIALELDGRQEEIEAAVEWFRAQGVTVEPIEKNVIE